MTAENDPELGQLLAQSVLWAHELVAADDDPDRQRAAKRIMAVFGDLEQAEKKVGDEDCVLCSLWQVLAGLIVETGSRLRALPGGAELTLGFATDRVAPPQVPRKQLIADLIVRAVGFSAEFSSTRIAGDERQWDVSELNFDDPTPSDVAFMALERDVHTLQPYEKPWLLLGMVRIVSDMRTHLERLTAAALS